MFVAIFGITAPTPTDVSIRLSIVEILIFDKCINIIIRSENYHFEVILVISL